jgi:hypothetical protein
MQVPALLRTWQKAAGADADFALTQAAPAASICVDVEGVNRLGVTFVAYTALDAVSTGTLDLQLIDVATPAPFPQGTSLPTLITGSPIDAGVDIGEGLQYDVSACRLVTIRVSGAALHADATYANIFWRALA